MRRELLDEVGEFADVPAAQAAIDAWVHTYNHSRPHQSLDMAVPASLFRPALSELAEPGISTAVEPATPLRLPSEHDREEQPAEVVADTSTPPHPAGPDAVELERLVPVSGYLGVLPRVQRIRLDKALAGRWVRIWADRRTIHVSFDGRMLTTVPSRLSAENLQELRMRGAQPAGPPPAPPAPAQVGTLPAGTAIEVDRTVGADGFANLAGHVINLGTPLARRRVTLRLDGHLLHVIDDGVLAKTLPSPIPADQRTRLRGARIAEGPTPPPPAGPINVTRRVPRDGVVMVTRQRLRVGAAHAGKTVTIRVEDTHFRVLLDGEELGLHPRVDNRPVTRFRAYATRSTDDQPSTMS